MRRLWMIAAIVVAALASGQKACIAVPDDTLWQDIAEELRSNHSEECRMGAYSPEDLAGISMVSTTAVNLSGLEACVNLRFLWIHPDDGGEDVLDLSPLANLHSLRYITINSYDDFDLTPLAGLPSLTELWLIGNIPSLSPLANLTSLQTLYVDSRNLIDVSPLAGLTNLTSIGLHMNMSKTLDMESAAPEEFSVDLSVLKQMPKLVDVDVSGLPNVDLATLAGIPKLQSLNVSGCGLNSLQDLAGKATLIQLDASNNALTDIDPVAGLPNLEELQIHNDAIWFYDADECYEIPHLTHIVWRGDNQIRDLSPVVFLGKLRRLEAGDRAEIRNYAPGGPLCDKTFVEYRDTSHNQIDDLSPLAILPHLEYVGLQHNAVCDLAPLVANAGIGSEDFINVSDNPLAVQVCEDQIPVLKIRGAFISNSGCAGLCPGEYDGEDVPGPAPAIHSADLNGNGQFDLVELLRVIQLYNAAQFSCGAGEDGYELGAAGGRDCQGHSADYHGGHHNWRIDLAELLRTVQLFNNGGYHLCDEGEDGYCAGAD